MLFLEPVTYTANFNVLERGIEAPSPCKRCSKKGLRCLVKLLTSFCACYICAKACCSLVLTNTKRREIRDKQRAALLRIAKAKAKLAAARVALLEAKEKEQVQELIDIIATKELEVLERAARIYIASPSLEPIAYTANLNILDLELLANLG